jgi:hypothetical protein
LPWPHAFLAAAYGLKGDADRASAELGETNEGFRRRGIPDNRWGTIALVRKNDALNTPALHERFEEFYITGLRKARLPEE